MMATISNGDEKNDYYWIALTYPTFAKKIAARLSVTLFNLRIDISLLNIVEPY